MARAIRDAGFTPVPEDVRLTVTGRLEARDGRIVLVLDGMKTPRELTCVGAPGRDSSGTTFEEHVGRAVEVRGRWLPGDPGALEVESIAPLPSSP
jgi:hypothetical protein